MSSVGFLNKEQDVDGQTTLNITMDSGNTELTEVVVIGYGTASRKDVTGSIASVKAEQLENENPQSVADLLKGNIAGLSVSQNTSAKGGGALLVRGKTMRGYGYVTNQVGKSTYDTWLGNRTYVVKFP